VVEAGNDLGYLWIWMWINASPSTFVAPCGQKVPGHAEMRRRGGDDCCRGGFLLPRLAVSPPPEKELND
jgi:hypothetical protein